MNSHINKEIFSETGCVNREVLLRYRDGKLSNSEKYEVEKHLIDCPLCTEALEGFALVSGTGSFDEINRELHEMTSGKVNTGIGRYLAVAASVAAMIVVSWFAYKQFVHVSPERMAVTEVKNEEPAPELIQQQAEVKPKNENSLVTQQPYQVPDFPTQRNNTENGFTSTFSAERVSADAETKNTDRITRQETVAPIEVDNEKMVAAAANKDVAVPTVMDEPVLEIADDELTLSGLATKGSTAGYATNVTYIDNLKVIDYSVRESEELSDKKVPSHVPGKYENRQKSMEAAKEEQQTGAVMKRKVSYLQKLADPVVLYNKGRYESAIRGFDELLAANPADENAKFYKGMSLYQLGKYDKAIEMLTPVASVKTVPFSEEALFYIAKSYVGKGDKEKAIPIFRSIVAKEGFYSKRAADELKDLK